MKHESDPPTDPTRLRDDETAAVLAPGGFLCPECMTGRMLITDGVVRCEVCGEEDEGLTKVVQMLGLWV